MANSKYELRLDLGGVDVDGLRTDEDFCREARRLLPTALEELGQAMAEAAWERQPEQAPGSAVEYRGAAAEMRAFVVEAGRRYRRHAPTKDRQALEQLLVRHLRAARGQAIGTADGGSTIPARCSGVLPVTGLSGRGRPLG